MIDRRYPNARRLQGGLFISHAGKDYERISQDLVMPFIHDRFAPRYFFHNRGSGGAEHYVELVRAALEYCDKFLVVVSRNSVEHPWVTA